VAAVPNVILPFFGGLILDKIGQRIGLILLVSILLISQIVFYLGAIWNNYFIILIGRFLMGIGGETFTVAILSCLTVWFGTNELSLAQGVFLSSAQLYSSLNSFITPKIYL